MTTETTTLYVIESSDGVILWLGYAYDREDALDRHLDDLGIAPNDEAAPTLDQVSPEGGALCAGADLDSYGMLTIGEAADDIQRVSDIEAQGCDLERVDSLLGWGVWRSLWSYINEDGFQCLIARTLP